MGFMSLIWLFTYCRLEYIKLGSQKDPTWSDFPQTLTQTQGVRRYVTLFESPFGGSELSERENNALRLSSLLAVPPPPPEVQPLEGLQGIDLPEANLTQWASYMQDVASWMQKPPCAATCCPSKDIAGILHKLENLTGIGFCRLCYTLGHSCRCSKATPQAPLGYRDPALWVLPQPSYASMASSMITTASTSTRFSCKGNAFTDGCVAGLTELQPANSGWCRRGHWLQPTPGSARPQAPGATSLRQE